jgi:hypothetical protein
MDRFGYFTTRESLFTKRRWSKRPGAGDGPARLSALWATWRFAAIEVEIAYDEWCRAPDNDNGRAYAVYLDSLRREGEAAERLAERYGPATPLAA